VGLCGASAARLRHGVRSRGRLPSLRVALSPQLRLKRGPPAMCQATQREWRQLVTVGGHEPRGGGWGSSMGAREHSLTTQASSIFVMVIGLSRAPRLAFVALLGVSVLFALAQAVPALGAAADYAGGPQAGDYPLYVSNDHTVHALRFSAAAGTLLDSTGTAVTTAGARTTSRSTSVPLRGPPTAPAAASSGTRPLSSGRRSVPPGPTSPSSRRAREGPSPPAVPAGTSSSAIPPSPASQSRRRGT